MVLDAVKAQSRLTACHVLDPCTKLTMMRKQWNDRWKKAPIFSGMLMHTQSS